MLEILHFEGYEYLLGNYPQEISGNTLEVLKPYESIVLLKKIRVSHTF